MSNIIEITDDSKLIELLATGTIYVNGGGGGGGANLAYTASPTQGIVTSDSGTDATIPAGSATNASLMLPADKTKLDTVASGATANATDAQLRDRSTHTGTQAIATVTGLQTALDGKQATGDYATNTALTNGLATKENTITAGTTAQYYRGDKTFQTLDKTAVGLANVDNTSDLNKPISTATQTALSAKQDTITNSDLITQGTTNLFLTTAERTKLTNTTGTNSGDNAVNTLYSGLVSNATHTGDVTGATTLTIANNAVTYAKIQNVTATDKLLGRSTAGAGIVEEINCTLAGRSLIAGVDASAQRTTLGLGNIDNTSDANKPVSTPTQTALNAKENTITAGTTAQYFRGDKTFQTLDKTAVGLSNVDNTSDANKPISTATQTALNAKQNTITTGTISQYFRGDLSLATLDKTAVGLSNVDNTSDADKPVSTTTQTALNAKENTLNADQKRKVTVSSSAPTGGTDGDVWLQYTP